MLTSLHLCNRGCGREREENPTIENEKQLKSTFKMVHCAIKAFAGPTHSLARAFIVHGGKLTLTRLPRVHVTET